MKVFFETRDYGKIHYLIEHRKLKYKINEKDLFNYIKNCGYEISKSNSTPYIKSKIKEINEILKYINKV